MKNSLVYCMKNPISRLSTIAGMFRYFGMYATDFYLASFYLQSFPGFKKEFGILFAASLFFGGLTSSIGGGVLADRFE